MRFDDVDELLFRVLRCLGVRSKKSLSLFSLHARMTSYLRNLSSSMIHLLLISMLYISHLSVVDKSTKLIVIAVMRDQVFVSSLKDAYRRHASFCKELHDCSDSVVMLSSRCFCLCILGFLCQVLVKLREDV